MKQKDIALILIIIFISGVFSFMFSNWLFSSAKSRSQEVEVVEAITADFEEPDKQYFNESSINPTQLIRIGDSPNNTPFNTKE